MLGLAFLALAAGPLPAPPIAHLAHGVLSRHCARCHDGQGPGHAKGKFDFVLDARLLASRGMVAPMIERVASGEMPPGKHTFTAADLGALQRWAAAGAPGLTPAAPPVRRSDLLALIKLDLASLPERERRHMRYLTLGHLGDGPDAATLRDAVAKLANSLSWHPRLTRPHQVTPLLLRLDLRDYRWTARVWEKLASLNPYRGEGEHVLRADWFVATASRPPMYHDFLQLPLTDRALERMAGVDVAAAHAEDRAVRAGFNNSGVARSNRILERVDGTHGAYWRSHDFSENIGRQNIFESPTTFRAAGGEIIFRLPNGLHAYLIVDGDGRRIDKAPGEVVQDPNRPDRLVENGLSCIGCHTNGIHPKDDQVRAHVLSHKKAFDAAAVEAALALYVPPARFKKLVDEDNAGFARAAAALRLPTSGPEPVMSAVHRYERVLDRAALAAELDTDAAGLAAMLSRDAELARAIAAGKGGTVQRDLLERLFTRLVEPEGPKEAIAALHEGHKGAVHAVALAEGWLLTGGADGQVLRARLSGGKPALIVKHPDEVRAVALSPDGKTCASASGRDVFVHSAAGKLIARLRGHTSEVRALAFLPGGKLVSGGADRTARVWDIAGGKEVAALVGHTGTVTSVTIGGGGKYVVTGSTDRSARWWDALTGKEVGARTADAEVHSVAWEGGILAAGTSDGVVRVWGSRTDTGARRLDGPEGTIRAVHLAKDGTVTACSARGALGWRWPASGKRWQSAQNGPVTAAAIGADGTLAAATADGVRLMTSR